MKKALKIIVGSLLILLLALTLTVLFGLGPILHTAIEKIGSQALGTPVSIESLTIHPRQGTLDLQGFRIQNLPGFEQPDLASLNQLNVAIDLKSLSTDTIVIKEILIDQPQFTYEQTAKTDVLTQLLKNIQAFAPPQKETEPKAPSTAEPKKVAIQQLTLKDLKVAAFNTDQPDLNTAFVLKSLTLSSDTGELKINGTAIKNPSSLTLPDLFTLGALEVKLDWDSLFSNKIRIHDIQLTQPHLHLEQGQTTDSIAELTKLAETFIAKIPAPTPEAKTSKQAPPAKPAPELLLEHIGISDVQARLQTFPDPESFAAASISNIVVNPVSGAIDIQHISVGNPTYFSTPNIFELANLSIQLNPSLFTGGAPDIQSVSIRSPHVILEQTAGLSANTTAWLKIADGFMKSVPAPDETAPSSPASSSAPPALKLGTLTVDDIQLITHSAAAPENNGNRASIEHIALNAPDGNLTISQILVPNLPGFTTTNLFSLDQIAVSFEPESLLTPPLNILDVQIDAPYAHLEQTASAGNVANLQRFFERFIPPLPETTAAAPAPQPAAAAAPAPVKLGTITINQFNVMATAPSKSAESETNSVSLLNLGKLKDTLTSAEEKPSHDTVKLLSFSQLQTKPEEGLLEIKDFTVGNPPHFAHSNLVELARFSMDIDPATITSNTLVIRDILIEKPTIAYERKLMKDNITVLQEDITAATTKRDNIMEKEAPEPTPKETAKATTDREPAPAQKVVINNLLVTGGMVKPKISALPTLPIPLPEIAMHDIGKESGGATFTETVSNLGTVFYDAILGSISGIGGLAGDTVKGAGNLTLDAGKAVTGGAGEALSGATDLTKGAVKGITGFIPGTSANKDKNEEKKAEETEPATTPATEPQTN